MHQATRTRFRGGDRGIYKAAVRAEVFVEVTARGMDKDVDSPEIANYPRIGDELRLCARRIRAIAGEIDAEGLL